MTRFEQYHAALIVAGELHDQLESLQSSEVNAKSLNFHDLEDLFSAKSSADRALRRLLKLTQIAANAEAATAAPSTAE